VSSVTVVSSNTATEQRLLGMYDGHIPIRKVWSEDWRDPSVAVLEICAANPSAIILSSLTDDDAMALISEIDRRYPSIGVLVLIEERTSEGVVNMLRAGARDVLDLSCTDDELRESLDDVLALVAEQQRSLTERGSGPPRRVVVMAGPKGGSGKTTLSTNLATGAARRYPGHVLLIDLDTQFGDVPSALGMEPEHSIADAVAVGVNARTALKVFLTVHESGLAFLAAPSSLSEASDLGEDAIKRTVAALIEEFPLVIIDTAAGIDEAALVAMEFATDLLLVSTPDVSSIRAIKKQLDALDAIGMNAPRRHLVINRADSRVGLGVAEIEETVGLEAEFRVPGSRQFPMSTNEGIPLLIGERRDKALKPLRSLVDFFAPEAGTGPANNPLNWLRRKDG
jgi:pilus assembly protein CpaE